MTTVAVLIEKGRLLLRLLRSEGMRSVGTRLFFAWRRWRSQRLRVTLDFGDDVPLPPRELGNVEGIDILVPVFDVGESTRACLDSVSRHTDLRHHRLVVIVAGDAVYDGSPYLQGLESWTAKGRRVEILRAHQGCGFAAAVDVGLQASGRDVVVLDSDTEVSSGWIEGLAAVARRSGTASVSALSNAATIYATPFAREGPPRPSTDTIHSHAQLVERCSLHRAPEVPIAAGPCRLVTRRALESVNGQGELALPDDGAGESVWSLEASRLGLIHRLADWIFVFSEEQRDSAIGRRSRSERSAPRRQARRQRKPRREVSAFLEQDPLESHHRAIQMLEAEIPVTSGRGVLHVVSSDPSHPKGGVDRHVAELRAGLQAQGWFSAAVWVEMSSSKVLWGESPERLWSFDLPSASAERALGQRLVVGYLARALGCSLVHVHDLRHFERRFLLDLELPIVISLHDFQLYCRRPHLMERTTSAFCDYSRDAVRCRRCLEASGLPEGKSSGNAQDEWRSDSAAILRRAAALVAPSRFMALAVADLFSDLRLESKTHVIENASAADLNLRGGESERRRERIRVVFVGQFTRSKGAAVFAQIVHELGRDRRFSFRAVGGVVDHESLRLARRAGRVRTTGWYQKEWLPELLDAHTDVVTLVSVVPESWSYTLSEVLAAGTPVVAFDFGAVGERLRRAGRQEWLVPREEGAAGFARRLRDYVEGRLRWSPGPVEDPWSFEQSTARYAELYEECAKRFKQDVSSPASGGAR